MGEEVTSPGASRPMIKTKVPTTAALAPKLAPGDACADAFLQWKDAQLGPSFNVEITFGSSQNQRLVIEFVMAMVEMPTGGSACLQMFTGLSNDQAGNFCLALTPQGIGSGQPVYVGTHMVCAYSDGFLPSTSTGTMPPVATGGLWA